MRSRFKLTVRRGAKVSRQTFDDLASAVEALETEARTAATADRLGSVSMLRTFEAGDRVAARIEISSGGWLRGSAAGVDVMGDGTIVAYTGGVTRSPLEPRGNESAFDAVRRRLS